MPPIVKACYASIKKHAGRHPVVLVTQDNIRQLLADVSIWDNVIFDYVENKSISLTHLSDFFRLSILYSNGGIWIDSTILMNRDIDEIIKGLAWVTGRVEKVNHNYDVPMGKWTSFFVGCSKGNLLMKLMYELLLSQLKKEGKFIDYFMIDYSFVTGYNNLPYIRDMVDSMPVFPNLVHTLSPMRNKKYNAVYLNQLMKNAPILKLGYKGQNSRHTKEGELTYYGYITKDYKD